MIQYKPCGMPLPVRKKKEKGYGDRVQYSVFEVFIKSKSQLKALCDELQPIVDEEDDADVRLYPLCGNCGHKISLKGETIGELPAVIIL